MKLNLLKSLLVCKVQFKGPEFKDKGHYTHGCLLSDHSSGSLGPYFGW